MLIAMIYSIRSTIPKGPYTWISYLCSLTLFLIVMGCLLLVLSTSSRVNSFDKNLSMRESNYIQSLDVSFEQIQISIFSKSISKSIMFPSLLMGMMICVLLNLRLVWIWYTTGQINTIVNKCIVMQRICIFTYVFGEAFDYTVRLYGPTEYRFISEFNYCLSWTFLYRCFMYGSMTSPFSAAMIRLACVKYPMEYHNR